MKKIMNTAESFVYDMCHGLSKAHPELEFVEKYKVVKKKVIDRDKVTLISGGGSGHEPAHAGFVGVGMLDADRFQKGHADDCQELLRRLHELQ